MKKKSKSTIDSYEAAYYLMHGAEVDSIKLRLLSKQSRKRNHYSHQYIIRMTNIPFWCIMGWNYGITYAPIHEFKKARLKLKKIINSLNNL